MKVVTAQANFRPFLLATQLGQHITRRNRRQGPRYDFKGAVCMESHSCHSVRPFNSMERRRCPSHQTNIYAMEAVGVVLPQGVSGGWINRKPCQRNPSDVSSIQSAFVEELPSKYSLFLAFVRRCYFAFHWLINSVSRHDTRSWFTGPTWANCQMVSLLKNTRTKT